MPWQGSAWSSSLTSLPGLLSPHSDSLSSTLTSGPLYMLIPLPGILLHHFLLYVPGLSLNGTSSPSLSLTFQMKFESPGICSQGTLGFCPHRAQLKILIQQGSELQEGRDQLCLFHCHILGAKHSLEHGRHFNNHCPAWQGFGEMKQLFLSL